MLLTLSYTLALAVLFAAAISDLKTTEVPDWLSVIGVVGGVVLHAAASYQAGIDYQTLSNIFLIVESPVTWLGALGEPLMWSLGIGALFSVYGWILYILGMWGGADAFAMSVLGFAVPYGFAGPDLMHAVNLFINIMFVGLLYTLLFAFYKSVQNKQVWSKTWSDIKEQEARITVEIIAAAAISGLGVYTGNFNGLTYFVLLVSFVFLYRFIKNIENDLMSKEVAVSELEGGEVLAKDEEKGGKVKGITQEEINSLEAEKVVIKEGVRFIPVFPVALVLTLFYGGGIEWLVFLIN